jgi:hypothetical protein
MKFTYCHVEVGVTAGPVGDPGEGVGHQDILNTIHIDLYIFTCFSDSFCTMLPMFKSYKCNHICIL